MDPEKVLAPSDSSFGEGLALSSFILGAISAFYSLQDVAFSTPFKDSLQTLLIPLLGPLVSIITGWVSLQSLPTGVSTRRFAVSGVVMAVVAAATLVLAHLTDGELQARF